MEAVLIPGSAALAAAAVLAAPPGPEPDDVYIEKITTGGKGCPGPASIATVLSEDRRTFLLIYSKMLLANPPGPALKSTSCKAIVHLHVPGGWKVSLADVTTRGYAFLDPGVAARQTTRHFFSGMPHGPKYTHDLAGPHDGFYDFSDVVAPESRRWSKCGAPGIFALDTELTLDASANPDGTAIFNATSSDGAFAKLLHWDWMPC